MIPWFLLYPALGALTGAGAAKLSGKDAKKGALWGAGLGLGAGALPILGGAGAGGSAGWNALAGSSQAVKAGLTASPGVNSFGSMLGNAGNAVLGSGTTAGTAGAGKSASLATVGKNALASQAVLGVLGAAMPKYGQTNLLVNPGFLQPQEDVTAQLMQLMQKKGVR